MTRRAATIPIGDRLRQLRLERKLNQHDMSHLIGTSQSRICDWETGKYRPQLTTLTRYSKALGISLSELLDGVA